MPTARKCPDAVFAVLKNVVEEGFYRLLPEGHFDDSFYHLPDVGLLDIRRWIIDKIVESQRLTDQHQMSNVQQSNVFVIAHSVFSVAS